MFPYKGLEILYGLILSNEYRLWFSHVFKRPLLQGWSRFGLSVIGLADRGAVEELLGHPGERTGETRVVLG